MAQISAASSCQQSTGRGATKLLCPTCARSEVDREGCTVIMVGKDASTDGSVMTTHTCDCGVCDWTFRRIPAADHKPGEKRKIYHIDQFEAFPPDIGLKWDEDQGQLHRPRAARAAAHLRLYPRRLRLHERQAGLDRRVHDRQRPQRWRTDRRRPSSTSRC